MPTILIMSTLLLSDGLKNGPLQRVVCDFLTTLCAHREMDELVAMGEDGKEIITPPGEIDFDPLRKAEEEGMKEGWWMEKVGDLKYKMERLLKLELSRYTPPARSSAVAPFY
jgi:hypothetical protein